MGTPIRWPRKRWRINPKTRVQESRKRDSRKRRKAQNQRELKALEP